MFEPCAFFLLRAPLLPLQTTAERKHEELLLSEAFTVTGRPDQGRLRLQRQMEPYGLYAGVAVGSVEDTTKMRLSVPTEHRTHTRPDQEWLWQSASITETRLEIIRELRVRTSPLVSYRESRAVLAYQNIPPFASQSIRLNSVIKQALSAAEKPIVWRMLVQRLLATFPDVEESALEGLLQQLLVHQFLHSELRPPLLGDDLFATLRHFGQQSIIEALSTYDKAPLGQGEILYQNVVVHMQTLANIPFPVHIDLSLKTHSLTLGRTVAEEAARAAEVLALLTYEKETERSFAAYADQFVTRYGEEAQVPLLDLLDPEIGLGAPALYAHPPSSFVLTAQEDIWQSQRDHCLLTWLADCQRTGSRVLELTPERLADLIAQRRQDVGKEPRSIELCVQISAASASAVDCGEYQMIVNNKKSSVGAGRLTARYQRILGETLERGLHSIQTAEQALEPDALFAEVVYVPSNKRLANVAVTARFRPFELLLDTFPAEEPSRSLSIADLAVVWEQDRLSLQSRSRNRRVIPTFGHRLNPNMAPNLYRFLHDMSTVSQCAWQPFSWGSLENKPFLPRLSMGRIVLAPARWKIANSGETRLGELFSDLPSKVQVWHGQQSIFLDIQNVVEREVLEGLYEALAPEEVLVIEEAWFEEKDCFVETLGGHLLMECVIPLVRRQV